MNALEIKNLSKSFGSQQVIKELNLVVPENCIFGFIGQNGAGKTTTMKMILGLLKSNHGRIQVYNQDVHFGQTNTNRFIGYLPDVPEFYNFMNAVEYLELCGQITGMSRDKIKQRISEMLTLVGLEDVRKKKIGSFSRGMKQRLGIAQALLNEPKLLICDEPTSALDPLGRKEILDILLSVKNKTTVIFSTHVLSDVERICDQIAILKDGEIAIHGTISEIKEKHPVNSIKIDFKTNHDLNKFINIYKDEFIIKTEHYENTFIVYSSQIVETQATILKALYENNLYPNAFELQEPTLESLFLEVIQ